ncbi:YSIRK-type signal peptide-containing protein, partial [Streptococcus gallolyticus]
MKKNVDTQQCYAFRKLKFGLVSVAVALLFG